MGISFFPNPTDVNRYRRLRALSKALNQKVLDTVPPRAFNEIGDAIGMRRNGTMVFETEDESSVLADCCLYDWFEDGKNLIQRYAEAHPARPGTDEAYLFNAYSHAKYRILTVQSKVLDAGLYCFDVLKEEEVFLMDLAFSRNLGHGILALATRTVPLGEFWMTGGAALPIASAHEIKSAFTKIDRRTLDSRDGPHGLPPLIIRACLAAGASERIRYEGSGSAARPRMPRLPESKRNRRLS